MKKSKYILAAAVISTCVSACGTTATNLRDNFGVAVNSANDKQIVSAAAVPGAPVMNPQVRQAAIDRYLTDTVKELESAGSAGSSEGGGGN